MWACGHNPLLGNAHDLTDDQVGALRIQLRVVVTKPFEPDVVLIGHALTGVIFLDSMGIFALHFL